MTERAYLLLAALAAAVAVGEAFRGDVVVAAAAGLIATILIRAGGRAGPGGRR